MTMKVSEWAQLLPAAWTDDLMEATTDEERELEASKYDILRTIADYNGGLTGSEVVDLARELDIAERLGEI